MRLCEIIVSKATGMEIYRGKYESGCQDFVHISYNIDSMFYTVSILSI